MESRHQPHICRPFHKHPEHPTAEDSPYDGGEVGGVGVELAEQQDVHGLVDGDVARLDAHQRRV